MKITHRSGRPAFTLIELMAVITIIIILAGLVVGGLGFVTERQAKEKARVQIALLSKAIEEYKLDIGVYPPTGNLSDNANGSKELYKALFYEGYDYSEKTTPPDDWEKDMTGGVKVPKATRIYLPDLDPKTSKQGWVDPVDPNTQIPNEISIKDPWGRNYGYRSAKNPAGGSNAAAQNPDFDIWSYGKDGKSLSVPSSKENRDDIKNF